MLIMMIHFHSVITSSVTTAVLEQAGFHCLVTHHYNWILAEQTCCSVENHISFFTIGHVMNCWNSVGQRKTLNKHFWWIKLSVACACHESGITKLPVNRVLRLGQVCVCVLWERNAGHTLPAYTLGNVNLSIHSCSCFWNNVTQKITIEW